MSQEKEYKHKCEKIKHLEIIFNKEKECWFIQLGYPFECITPIPIRFCPFCGINLIEYVVEKQLIELVEKELIGLIKKSVKK